MKRRYCLVGLFGLLLTLMVTARAEEVFEADGRFMTKEMDLNVALNPNAKVLISSARHLIGRLYIVADNSAQVSFQYKKILKVPKEATAVYYAELIDITLEKTPTGAKLVFKAPNPAPWSGTDNSASIEGELHLPGNAALEINADYFDLNVEGPLRAIDNMSSFGRMEVRKITERLNLTTSNQDIVATDITGEIFLAATNGDIRVEKMQSGSTPAQLRNQNGNVTVTQASGALDIKNSYGKIRLEDINLTMPGSRVAGSYGPVRMTLSTINKATLEMTNTNDDIELSVPADIAASFALTVGSDGEISADGLMMKPTGVQNNRLNFTSGGGGSDISIRVSGDGNIHLSGTASGGK